MRDEANPLVSGSPGADGGPVRTSMPSERAAVEVDAALRGRRRPRLAFLEAFEGASEWRIIPLACLAVSGAGLGLGLASLNLNSLDRAEAVALVMLAAAYIALFVEGRKATGAAGRWQLVLAGLSICAALFVTVVGDSTYGVYMYGFEINAVAHRSLFGSIFLIGLSVPAMCTAIYYTLGATPHAHDLSRYPIVLLPVALVLAAYALIFFAVAQRGMTSFDWDRITEPYVSQSWKEPVYEGDNPFPKYEVQSIESQGLRNHILGTFLLIGMTAAIALPIGVGVGIFTSEYSRGWSATAIRFATASLSGMSVFILALMAMTLVHSTNGTFLQDVFSGFYFDQLGNKHSSHGSFITASLLVSLLVVPVIARATEEGCRSVPHELREGSYGLGASEGHTLLRIVLPWTLPNVITGLLLGCAQAAGSFAVFMFIAGAGQYGIGPMKEVTTLDTFIFKSQFGSIPFKDAMGEYRYLAALLLLGITFILSVSALALKRSMSKRYRGA